MKMRSRSEIKRLIRAGATSYNGKVIKDPKQIISPVTGDVIRIGKREFYRVVVRSSWHCDIIVT